MKFITQNWYNEDTHPPAILRSLSRLYGKVITHKRSQFLKNQKNRETTSVPVIVIGNITVGGTGKTPFVITLTQYLLNKGYKVGIISRGYKGKAKQWPVEVTSSSNVEQVGDEPVLMAQSTGVPVFVGPKRNDSIKALLSQYMQTSVILSDDGLQHYAMMRDIEVVVIDAKRMFGNEQLLPAGPLRELTARLKTVDLCVYNGLTEDDNIKHKTNHDYAMRMKLGVVNRLSNQQESKELADFKDKRVHGVAGIGNPSRFFEMLKEQELNVVEHAFNDHHLYLESDLAFSERLPILMTEKDAVKCTHFDISDAWVVTSKAHFDEKIFEKLTNKLTSLGKNNG